MSNQKSLYIIIGILIVLNIAILSYFLGVYRFGGTMMWGEQYRGGFDSWSEMEKHMEEERGMEEMMHREESYDKPVVEAHGETYDFGGISKGDGVVSTVFEIENHGREVLEIGGISTSCGCTTAEIDRSEIGFNEKADLTVYFDPNFHDEPQGKITRSVFVETNDADMPEMRFDIFVEILD